MVPGAGLEPAQDVIPRDFKSLASTSFATRATDFQSSPKKLWRLGSESNRRPRLCRPLHNHSATQPYVGAGLRRDNITDRFRVLSTLQSIGLCKNPGR